MSNSVFSEGDIKRFKLLELQGKLVDIVSVGKTEEGYLIYMRDIKTKNIYVIYADGAKEEYYKDFILKSFTNVDFTETKAAMIVIYDHPEDYPNSYVARIWNMDKPTNIVVINEKLERLRSLVPNGMGCIKRFEHDDPCIVEVWL